MERPARPKMHTSSETFGFSFPGLPQGTKKWANGCMYTGSEPAMGRNAPGLPTDASLGTQVLC